MSILDFSNYTCGVAAIQIVAAYLIYYITNWLGGHTPADRGYMTLSLIAEQDTMPAFNFIFKTLTPIVLYIFYIVLCQSVDCMGLFLTKSYIIILYYWLWRFLYYTIHDVWRLVNWKTLFLYVVVTLALAICIYRFSENVKSMLPDAESLRDQLWILIAIFVYEVLNKLGINRGETEDRKSRYILTKYAAFKKEYGDIISKQCKTLVDEGLVYSIMIVENYNRPRTVRFLENFVFLIKRKKMSLGIMQVKTKKFINDTQSVQLATQKIIDLREQFMKPEHYDTLSLYENRLSDMIRYVANEYNGGGENYANEVEAIYQTIYNDVFPNLWEIKANEALVGRRQ